MKAQHETMKQENKALLKLIKNLNIDILNDKLSAEDKRALFIKDQLQALNKKKMTWSDSTVRYCVLIQQKSPSTYRLITKPGILSLPSPSTLKRYIGYHT